MLDPTPEQSTIIQAARTTTDNLIINALAGSAKTTTLEMITRAVTGIPILSLAFNKRIADEMAKRLPSHVKAQTMNSLGHGVWSKVIGRRLIVEPKKMADIVKTIIKTQSKAVQAQAWEEFADTMLWLRRAKRDGFVPIRWRDNAQYFVDEDDWLSSYDDEPIGTQFDIIEMALAQSITDAYNGLIDFDDQIYMPVCFGGTWPRYPLVLVDEFQDLNELQHEMLGRLVAKRLIGVGDPWQSIYAFRGAKQNGMVAARERWSMTEFPLSVTFRVPQAGVRRAWFRVPHMKWAEDAPEGEVNHLDTWGEKDVPDGAAIVCRNNAPLFRCAMRLLRSGRGIKLVGFDIGPGLVKTLKGLGPLDMREVEAQDAVTHWYTSEIKRGRKESTVAERSECLHTLIEGKGNLQNAISGAEDLFRRDGLIQLLSIHKAKGLEWPHVFHLDPWRIPSPFVRKESEEWEQEMNARYVAETRFKKSLSLVTMEGMT